VRAYGAWLERSGIVDGPLFRSVTRHGRMSAGALSSAAVALVVKRAVVSVALADGMTLKEAQALAEAFAGHSLRAGHATSASQNDAPGHAIQRRGTNRSTRRPATSAKASCSRGVPLVLL
jgi:hypothetical protein